MYFIEELQMGLVGVSLYCAKLCLQQGGCYTSLERIEAGYQMFNNTRIFRLILKVFEKTYLNLMMEMRLPAMPQRENPKPM